MVALDKYPSRPANGPIAVIGMGCRLPGDIDSPAALWNLLMEGREAVGPREQGHRVRDGKRDGGHGAGADTVRALPLDDGELGEGEGLGVHVGTGEVRARPWA
ncbi:beta-ketoacyl synthase N-terminal-like domain-containing protein, partial [Streptomyces goshikiensis]